VYARCLHLVAFCTFAVCFTQINQFNERQRAIFCDNTCWSVDLPENSFYTELLLKSAQCTDFSRIVVLFFTKYIFHFLSLSIKVPVFSQWFDICTLNVSCYTSVCCKSSRYRSSCFILVVISVEQFGIIMCELSNSFVILKTMSNDVILDSKLVSFISEV